LIRITVSGGSGTVVPAIGAPGGRRSHAMTRTCIPAASSSDDSILMRRSTS
jgi:hypothetical protein